MIIGRKQEISTIKEVCERDESQFIVVYGRRRVGKTYLVREVFDNKFTFQYSGVANVSNAQQLSEFHRALLSQGLKTEEQPKDWFDAFHQLFHLIEQSKDEKKIVFIDEMPWMDARNSHFVTALEHFWNAYATTRKDVVLVVCGSATSWIIKKVFRNIGGLYGRVNRRIYLRPFTLKECEEYAQSRKLHLSREEIMEAYMIFGGVAFYWSLFTPSKSLTQNIDSLMFEQDGELRHEFNTIYESMFSTPESYINVVKALGGKKAGMTREEIIKKGKLTDNGGLTRTLEDLENCGLIRKYRPLLNKNKDTLFQLIDNFTLFHFHFLIDKAEGVTWSQLQQQPIYNMWCCLAFERLCLLHIDNIREVIGINKILCGVYSWVWKGDEVYPGCQIDLVIDRSDGVINLCEIKYSKKAFVVNKKTDMEIRTKAGIFIGKTGTKKSVRSVLITANGLVRNAYSDDIPDKVDANDFF